MSKPKYDKPFTVDEILSIAANGPGWMSIEKNDVKSSAAAKFNVMYPKVKARDLNGEYRDLVISYAVDQDPVPFIMASCIKPDARSDGIPKYVGLKTRLHCYDNSTEKIQTTDERAEESARSMYFEGETPSEESIKALARAIKRQDPITRMWLEIDKEFPNALESCTIKHDAKDTPNGIVRYERKFDSTRDPPELKKQKRVALTEPLVMHRVSVVTSAKDKCSVGDIKCKLAKAISATENVPLVGLRYDTIAKSIPYRSKMCNTLERFEVCFSSKGATLSGVILAATVIFSKQEPGVTKSKLALCADDFDDMDEITTATSNMDIYEDNPDDESPKKTASEKFKNFGK